MGLSSLVDLLPTTAGNITAKEVPPHYPLELLSQGRGWRMQTTENMQRPR